MFLKKLLIILIIYFSLICVSNAEMRHIQLKATRVVRMQQTIDPNNIISCFWGQKDLGGTNGGGFYNYYRSIWSCDLSILANATSVDRVLINISTDPNSNSAFTARILSGSTFTNVEDCWQLIDDGIVTDLNFPYGTNPPIESSINGYLLNYLISGKLYFGILNTSYNMPDDTYIYMILI